MALYKKDCLVYKTGTNSCSICAGDIDNNSVGFFQRWKRRYFKLREGNKLYYAKSSEVRRSIKL